MKSFRQSQAFLHTWSGLVLGWVLFLIFLAGTLAFWREGLNRWTRPEAPRVEQPMRVLAGAQAFLAAKAPDADTWFITLATERSPGANLFWVPAAKPGEKVRRRGRRDTQALIGADGQEVRARATRGGEFFYRFHFDLHYMSVIWARWIVGAAAAAMLVAILSGIVTHKKIFRDFFTLRRGRGQRSWLDGHNATAVLALPFHLMITYTGIVTLMALLMPWAVVANYTDEAKLSEALFPSVGAAERTGRPAPLVDLTRIAADAEARLGAPAGNIAVTAPGDAAARVTVSRANSSMLNTRTPSLAYDGVTGRLIWAAPAPTAAAETAGVMIGLHAGRFAGYGMRWLYFLCGVAGTLMVASGLVLWTVKRREKLADPARPHFGFRLVERLNVAVIGGLPLGIVAWLWANRLLSLAATARADAEVDMLFTAWGAAAILALVRRPATVWPVLFGLTGAGLVALPVYDLVATERGLVATLAAGDMMLAGIDIAMLVFGLAFLLLARRVALHRPAVRPPRAARARVAAPVLEPAE